MNLFDFLFSWEYDENWVSERSVYKCEPKSYLKSSFLKSFKWPNEENPKVHLLCALILPTASCDNLYNWCQKKDSSLGYINTNCSPFQYFALHYWCHLTSTEHTESFRKSTIVWKAIKTELLFRSIFNFPFQLSLNTDVFTLGERLTCHTSLWFLWVSRPRPVYNMLDLFYLLIVNIVTRKRKRNFWEIYDELRCCQGSDALTSAVIRIWNIKIWIYTEW